MHHRPDLLRLDGIAQVWIKYLKLGPMRVSSRFVKPPFDPAKEAVYSAHALLHVAGRPRHAVVHDAIAEQMEVDTFSD